jgi:hypothetical protein
VLNNKYLKDNIMFGKKKGAPAGNKNASGHRGSKRGIGKKLAVVGGVAGGIGAVGVGSLMAMNSLANSMLDPNYGKPRAKSKK